MKKVRYRLAICHLVMLNNSDQSNLSFYMILQILVYINKNKMAKYLQLKIMGGETTCKETLYKPRPHSVNKKERKKKLN